MNSDRNPPKIINVLGIDCYLDERSLTWDTPQHFWQSNQKEMLHLSIAVWEQLDKYVKPQKMVEYHSGWYIRVEWFNQCSNRTFIVTRTYPTLFDAENEALNQLSRLVDGAKKTHTLLTYKKLTRDGK